jgi:hypothetical protein
MNRKFSFTCPHCETPLFRESLSLLPSFQCTKCHANLRISRIYAIAARILAGALSVAVCLLLGASGHHLFEFLLLFAVFSFISYMPISFLLATRFSPRVHDGEETFVRLDIPH